MTGPPVPARRVGNSLLCGRPDRYRGHCGGLIAIVLEDAAGPGWTFLMLGMIEDPPGSHVWRLSNRAKKQRQGGQEAPGHSLRATRGPGVTGFRPVPMPWRRLCPDCLVLAEVTAESVLQF